jgi:hypothetical protein
MIHIILTQAEVDAALAQIEAAQADFPCDNDERGDYLSGDAADAIDAPGHVRQVIIGDMSGYAAGTWDSPVAVETIREALAAAVSGGVLVSDWRADANDA